MTPRPHQSIDQRSSPNGTSAHNQSDGPTVQRSALPAGRASDSQTDRANPQDFDQSLQLSRSCDPNATPRTDIIPLAALASSPSSYRLNRRDLLVLAAAGAAVLSMPRWLQSASAQATTTIITKTPDPKSQQHADFLALSTLLTSNTPRNATISARLYAALSAQVIEFEKQSADLWQFVQTQQIKDVDALVTAVASNADLTKVLHQIVGAWYLGVVGSGPQAKVIAFDQALMFDAVRDAVVVPTYCRAAPGYWTTQPAVLKARV